MSNTFEYEKLIKKYCLQKTDILLITDSVLKNKGLEETQSEINGRLSQEKIYVIAKSICQDLVGEDIAFVAPLMVKQRKELALKNRTKSKGNKTIGNKLEDSSQSAEDILNILSEIFYDSEL